MGTFGELEIYNDMEPAFKCFTVERPWLNNQAMISCVPAGDYLLDTHSSTRFGETFALVGETVSHWAKPGIARSTCLIHTANHWQQVNGCIGLGQALGFVDNQWAVLNSKKTVNEFLELLHSVKETHTLTIEWARQ